jgi:uncharacterized OB-fold protein
MREAPALPAIERDSREWWEALARHELTLQRCDACGRLRWPARALCNGCGSLDWSWTRASGRGRVASWIVNHHPFGAALPSPYVVVMVRLDEQDDILMPGTWAGARDGTDLAIDASVALEFDDVRVPGGQPALSLLRWRAAGA